MNVVFRKFMSFVLSFSVLFETFCRSSESRFVVDSLRENGKRYYLYRSLLLNEQQNVILECRNNIIEVLFNDAESLNNIMRG